MRFIFFTALLVGMATTQVHGSELGRQVFVKLSTPQCALCHTLADAGATGKIGPNLDELKPTEDKVNIAVTQGFENMPAYDDVLTQEQIDAVSEYVATAAMR